VELSKVASLFQASWLIGANMAVETVNSTTFRADLAWYLPDKASQDHELGRAELGTMGIPAGLATRSVEAGAKKVVEVAELAFSCAI